MTDAWIEGRFEDNVIMTTIEQAVNWSRQSSIWPMTFGIACCAIEMMAAGATLATTVATMFSLFYLYMYFRNRKHIVWEEVNSSIYNRKERAISIIKTILMVSVPISISRISFCNSKKY